MRKNTLPTTHLNSAPTIAEVYQAFLTDKHETTIRGYLNDIEHLKKFLKYSSPESMIQAWTKQSFAQVNLSLLQYRQYLSQANFKASTINRRTCAIRTLFKTLRTLGILNYEPTLVGMRHEAYRDTRGPKREVVRGIIEKVDEEAITYDPKASPIIRYQKFRNSLILHLLYDMALRRGEIHEIRLQDIDLDYGAHGALMIRAKGSYDQTALPLPSSVRTVIDRLLPTHPDPVPEAPLLVRVDHCSGHAPRPKVDGGLDARTRLADSRKGPGMRVCPLTPTSIYRIVKELADINPHALRHSAITTALDVTQGNVREVMKFSRHKSLKTLVVYDDARRDTSAVISELVTGS